MCSSLVYVRFFGCSRILPFLYTQVDCLVCSYCFRFIGSVELQIGRKLYLQALGLSVKHECGIETLANDSEDTFQTDSMDVESSNQNHNSEGSSSSSRKENAIPEGVLASLMNRNLILPYSDQFSLPPVFSCPGGCEEEHYCRLGNCASLGHYFR